MIPDLVRQTRALYVINKYTTSVWMHKGHTSTVAINRPQFATHRGVHNQSPWKILQWRHNGRGSVSNHQPHHCLLNCLFRRRSKKTSKLRVTGFVRGIHRRPVNSPHKWPVTRKMVPFDDVIMHWLFDAIVDNFQNAFSIHFHINSLWSPLTPTPCKY